MGVATFADADYVLIGAGIHSLSLGWRLGELSRLRGKSAKIMILDKNAVGAGASGIACGVVRNNYYQPAMRELMAHSVSVWESDPKAFHYNPVGYMQISPECMHENVAQIFQEQKAIGYDSTFLEGEHDCTRYMKAIFEDWKAEGITSVLHEKRGGFAYNKASLSGLMQKAEHNGVEILAPCRVLELERDHASNAVKRVITERGAIECGQVVIAVGPWVRDFWAMLSLPETITLSPHEQPIPMWSYWQLEEGVINVSPDLQKANDGSTPPVIHVDNDRPLYSEQGEILTEDMWGIYYKPDTRVGGVQGGSAPYKIDRPAKQIAVDPYGPESDEFIASKTFPPKWCSALAFCQKRFEGKANLYRNEPSGGVGCFSLDNFPIFDKVGDNVYIVADSNHGYKMIGVGHLVAQELLGEESELLKPFRFSRFAEGKLHPKSNSPFPWS